MDKVTCVSRTLALLGLQPNLDSKKERLSELLLGVWGGDANLQTSCSGPD